MTMQAKGGTCNGGVPRQHKFMAQCYAMRNGQHKLSSASITTCMIQSCADDVTPIYRQEGTSHCRLCARRHQSAHQNMCTADKVAGLACQSAQQHGTHHRQAGRCTGTALYAAHSIRQTAPTATIADTDQQQSW